MMEGSSPNRSIFGKARANLNANIHDCIHGPHLIHVSDIQIEILPTEGTHAKQIHTMGMNDE